MAGTAAKGLAGEFFRYSQELMLSISILYMKATRVNRPRKLVELAGYIAALKAMCLGVEVFASVAAGQWADHRGDQQELVG